MGTVSMRYSLLVLVMITGLAVAQTAAPENPLRAQIAGAVDQVRPALVRIHVVETYYREGREQKYESSGSGVVITPEGHVVTNHHVAGHAKQLKCTFADKEEIAAELVGTDPLTDIAIIKLVAEPGRTFATASFGDSETVKVGDHVLAMGSPLSLSQSVTLGIVSNTEMIMPEWMSRRGGRFELDGENVGGLVRWLAHDADIFGGNSGGPLVGLDGSILGINEISMGLSGAIPGNLAKDVAEEIIATGKVKRAWLGVDVQPRLKHDSNGAGVLVSGVIKDSPAETAGFESGDLMLSLAGQPLDIRFRVQLPDLNRIVAELPIGETVEAVVLRDGQEKTLSITPTEREPYQHKQYEVKPWGITIRDISFMMAKEMKRKDTDGVLVTSVRPGGPVGDAEPSIRKDDIIIEVNNEKIRSVRDMIALTESLTKDATEPVPVLTSYERKTQQYVTAVKVGIKDIPQPGLEVKKAWLPVKTQVITRDIASLLDPDLKGFRITHVFKGSTAEEAGLLVGDIITAVDGEPMTASAPEHHEELDAWIRQYRADTVTELAILRNGESLTVPVTLVRAPKQGREMKKYRDDLFEFTVRDIAFFDKAEEQWKDAQRGVLVEQVVSGGWAALGGLNGSDLIQGIDSTSITDVKTLKTAMESIAENKPAQVVIKVLRGIHTHYIELEPKWNSHAESTE